MYEIIELKDGSIVIPSCLSDVLDVVEERLGTDMRQYLELYLLEEEVPPAMLPSEQMQTVLEAIDAQLSLLAAELEEAKATPVRVQEYIGKIRSLIERN